jgi:hypothetical protein
MRFLAAGEIFVMCDLQHTRPDRGAVKKDSSQEAPMRNWTLSYSDILFIWTVIFGTIGLGIAHAMGLT